MKDYYKILEVEENASEEEIKKSYRTLSKKYHPDVNPNGAEKFKEIAEAYETLGSHDKKIQYDNIRKNPFTMGGSSLQDLFNQMFGKTNQHSRRTKSVPDKILRLAITPIESYLGAEKNIQYSRDFGCTTCSGRGGEQQTCMTCKGLGYQLQTFGTGFMMQQIKTQCQTCAGRGYTLVHKCITCNGKGSTANIHELKIKLPVGSDSGQFLKLQNLGDFRDGEYGDLVIQIEMISVNGYEKMNDDLIYNLILNLEEIQKEKFRIPHPDGDLNLDAPKNIDTSKPLRLRGKGYNGGDMYVKLILKFERNI